jgi:hypothetical protein
MSRSAFQPYSRDGGEASTTDSKPFIFIAREQPLGTSEERTQQQNSSETKPALENLFGSLKADLGGLGVNGTYASQLGTLANGRRVPLKTKVVGMNLAANQALGSSTSLSLQPSVHSGPAQILATTSMPSGSALAPQAQIASLGAHSSLVTGPTSCRANVSLPNLIGEISQAAMKQALSSSSNQSKQPLNSTNIGKSSGLPTKREIALSRRLNYVSMAPSTSGMPNVGPGPASGSNMMAPGVLGPGLSSLAPGLLTGLSSLAPGLRNPELTGLVPGPSDLCSLLALPKSEARKILGVSKQKFSDLVKQSGIQRWPHRQLAGLVKLAKETMNDQTLEGQDEIKKQRFDRIEENIKALCSGAVRGMFEDLRMDSHVYHNRDYHSSKKQKGDRREDRRDQSIEARGGSQSANQDEQGSGSSPPKGSSSHLKPRRKKRERERRSESKRDRSPTPTRRRSCLLAAAEAALAAAQAGSSSASGSKEEGESSGEE